MIHCNLFESGKNTMNKTGVWRLRKYETPWECHDNCYDSSEKQSTEVYANISNEDKDHNGKNALPSLSSLHKYTMNDINPEAMILPSLMKGLSPENNKYEDCNGFIQNLM